MTRQTKAKKQGKKKAPKGAQTSGSKTSSRPTTQPAAKSRVTKNPTQFTIGAAISHNDFGSGVRVTGRQYLTSCITTGSDTQLFSGNSPVNVNTFYISPDTLNGRVALVARNYARYAFRKIKFVYEPRCATTQAGGYAMAYATDSASNSFVTNDFTRTQDYVPSITGAFRDPSCLEMSYRGDLTWLTELDSTSSASVRQTVQGSLLGFPDASAIGAVTMGHLHIEYVLDLYGTNADYGFTVQLRSREEEALVREFVTRTRLADADFDDLSSVSSRRAVSAPTQRRC